jgi:tetratricopeptide (TPR) repeat protein
VGPIVAAIDPPDRAGRCRQWAQRVGAGSGAAGRDEPSGTEASPADARWMLWADLRLAAAAHDLDRGELHAAEEDCFTVLREVVGGGPRAREVLATVHHQLGVLAYRRGRYDDAALAFRRSLEMDEQGGNEGRLAASHHELGMVAAASGKTEEARRWYGTAMELHARNGDEAGAIATLTQLGLLELDSGHPTAAEACFREADDRLLTCGDDRGRGRLWHNLGIAREQRGNLDVARDFFDRALRCRQRAGDRRGQVLTCAHLAQVCLKTGKPDEAHSWLRHALEIWSAEDDGSGPPEAVLALLHEVRRRPPAPASGSD